MRDSSITKLIFYDILLNERKNLVSGTRYIIKHYYLLQTKPFQRYYLISEQ